MAPSREAPLAGVRVLDFTQNLPGPYATLVLASLGADVIKIEPPSGDTARMTPRLFEIVNAGKRSCVLDLKDAAAAATLSRLLATADVVVEGFRPGVMAKFGADADAALRINPRLVYCSISGYGQDGPYVEYPGHDLNFQALTGVCDMSRDAREHPFGSALPIADLSSAMTAVSAILAGLFARERSGKGRAIDVAMIDTLRSWTHAWAEGLTPSDGRASGLVAGLDRRLDEHAPAGALGTAAKRVSAWLGRDDVLRRADAIGERVRKTSTYRKLVRLRLHALPHYGLFRTRDDRWLSIAIVDEQKFWRALCEGLALPRLAAIPLGLRMVGAAPLRRWVAAAIARHDLAHWLQHFDRTKVPVAPVVPIDEVAADPQLAWRLARTSAAVGAPVPLVATALGRAPTLGEHTAAVLA
jgi:crotonobetainyl-CoA:carnitine CoA-transferase CaiB-like acyl-CoA transferase